MSVRLCSTTPRGMWPCSFLNILGQMVKIYMINSFNTKPIKDTLCPSKFKATSCIQKHAFLYQRKGIETNPAASISHVSRHQWELCGSKATSGNRVSFQGVHHVKACSRDSPWKNRMRKRCTSHWDVLFSSIFQVKTGLPSRHPQVGNVRKHPWRTTMAPDTTATKDSQNEPDGGESLDRSVNGA